MRNVAAETEELREDDVEDGKQEQRPQKCPKVAEDGALITEFEITFAKLFQKDAVALIPDSWYVHDIYYIIKLRTWKNGVGLTTTVLRLRYLLYNIYYETFCNYTGMGYGQECDKAD